MTLETLASFIQNVGACVTLLIAACYYIKYQSDNYRGDIAEITEKHKAEMENVSNSMRESLNAVTEALNNNTVILSKLETMLENDRKKE